MEAALAAFCWLGGQGRLLVRRDVWARILRRSALRYRKPHALRHSFASLLIEAGEPLSPTYSSSSAITPPPSPWLSMATCFPGGIVRRVTASMTQS